MNAPSTRKPVTNLAVEFARPLVLSTGSVCVTDTHTHTDTQTHTHTHTHTHTNHYSRIDMYNNNVSQESAINLSPPLPTSLLYISFKI